MPVASGVQQLSRLTAGGCARSPAAAEIGAHGGGRPGHDHDGELCCAPLRRALRHARLHRAAPVPAGAYCMVPWPETTPSACYRAGGGLSTVQMRGWGLKPATCSETCQGPACRKPPALPAPCADGRLSSMQPHALRKPLKRSGQVLACAVIGLKLVNVPTCSWCSWPRTSQST